MNTNALITRSCCVALGVLALAAVSATPSTAAATTIDEFYQETTSTQSLDGVTASPNCPATQSCFFLFSRVKVGQNLVISSVSCTIPHNAGTARFAALMPQFKGALLPRTQYFVPVPTTNDRVTFNTQTLQLFKARESPVVQVVFDQPVNIFGSCTIAGQIRTAP